MKVQFTSSLRNFNGDATLELSEGTTVKEGANTFLNQIKDKRAEIPANMIYIVNGHSAFPGTLLENGDQVNLYTFYQGG